MKMLPWKLGSWYKINVERNKILKKKNKKIILSNNNVFISLINYNNPGNNINFINKYLLFYL